MTNWVQKIKSVLVYFWGTHDDKYIVNEDGLKIVFIDRSYGGKSRNTSQWDNKNRNTTTYHNKNIS